MDKKIRVTVWNEGRHEKSSKEVAAVYPKGIHGAIAEFLGKNADMTVRTATLDDPQQGLTDEAIAGTDVLIWWGHMAHEEVKDELVSKVQKAILEGMGLIVLHSGHHSKLFRRMMGTSCLLKWREANDREVLWVSAPGHPIVAGIDDHFIIPREEMYGEFFDIAEPAETVLISSFTGGEVFRSGVTFRRGAGKIFYFRPGHETYPTYAQKEVQTILTNAVRWAAPTGTWKIEGPMKPMGWIDGKA